MKKRNIFFDFLLYSYTSILKLFFKGKYKLCIDDLGYFLNWRRYRYSNSGTLEYQIPWLVFSAINYLENFVTTGSKIFEYGSGGSTLFFAKKGASIISVEHDRGWYENAYKVITHSGYDNIKYQLIEPALDLMASSKNCTDFKNYKSCFKEYEGYEFSSYAKAIDIFPDEQFDIVVVDGRVRHSCIAHAKSKVKKGGILLLDNADRPYYLEPFPEFSDSDKWLKHTFIGHFPYGPASYLNTTIIFIKK